MSISPLRISRAETIGVFWEEKASIMNGGGDKEGGCMDFVGGNGRGSRGTLGDEWGEHIHAEGGDTGGAVERAKGDGI